MRKLIMFNMMTLDGFFSGPSGELDWHQVDEEFNEFAVKQLNSINSILFGRKTYELMVSYWTTPYAIKNDPVVARLMNTLPKIVYSKKMAEASWNNTTLVKDNVVEKIIELKKQPGKDLIILGSADLASTLIQNLLIDEYRVMINPVILGSGNPLFKNLHERLNLKLVETSVFKSGNILLYYRQGKGL